MRSARSTSAGEQGNSTLGDRRSDHRPRTTRPADVGYRRSRPERGCRRHEWCETRVSGVPSGSDDCERASGRRLRDGVTVLTHDMEVTSNRLPHEHDALFVSTSSSNAAGKIGTPCAEAAVLVALDDDVPAHRGLPSMPACLRMLFSSQAATSRSACPQPSSYRVWWGDGMGVQEHAGPTEIGRRSATCTTHGSRRAIRAPPAVPAGGSSAGPRGGSAPRVRRPAACRGSARRSWPARSGSPSGPAMPRGRSAHPC